MTRWEYLVVHTYYALWSDSRGNRGDFPKIKDTEERDDHLPMNDWYNSGPLLASWGSEGWELISVANNQLDLPDFYFKRPLS
jgi:hypothetical protein